MTEDRSATHAQLGPLDEQDIHRGGQVTVDAVKARLVLCRHREWQLWL